MKASRNSDISYGIVRSRRSTADIVVERDGRVIVRAPAEFPDERIEDIVQSKRYWIYKTLAEWRDLNATRVLREYRNGEGFLYLGRSYRSLLLRIRLCRCCYEMDASACVVTWWTGERWQPRRPPFVSISLPVAGSAWFSECGITRLKSG